MRDKNDFSIGIDFSEGIGTIPETAFEENLPEGLEMKHFDLVDNYRDDFAASVGESMLGHAPGHFAESEDDLTVSDYPIGGNGTLSMTLNSEGHLLTQIEIAGNEALRAIQDKAAEIVAAEIA